MWPWDYLILQKNFPVIHDTPFILISHLLLFLSLRSFSSPSYFLLPYFRSFFSLIKCTKSTIQKPSYFDHITNVCKLSAQLFVGLCLVDRRCLSFNGELLRCRASGRVSTIVRANIPKLGTRFGCCRVTVAE
jgi:hypothetical protein